MNLFKSVFPYTTENEIPVDIHERLSKFAFDELPDGRTKMSGFALLTESERAVNANGRWLFKYVEQNRKSNIHSVNRLYNQRLQQATESGRALTKEDEAAHREQAEREVLKYAPISESVVFILYDERAGRVLCSGGTAKKCEDALKALRGVLGNLQTLPLSYEQAGKTLARHLAPPAGRPAHHTARLPEWLHIPANGKVVATDDGQKATFDGIDMRDDGLRDVIAGMEVRAVEMELIKRNEAGEYATLASFVLHLPEKGNLHLKGYDFDGSRTEKSDDEAHDYAATMHIIATDVWRVLMGLQAFFSGATSH